MSPVGHIVHAEAETEVLVVGVFNEGVVGLENTLSKGILLFGVDLFVLLDEVLEGVGSCHDYEKAENEFSHRLF